MTDDRRMTTDRFFGGVDGRLQNLRSMFRFVDEEKPTQQELWQWLRSNTNAEKDSTIQTYTAFQRSLGLLERENDQYRLTLQGREYLDSGDPEVVFDALVDHVKGFETILQSVVEGYRTKEEIQTQLQNRYPGYKLPAAVVGRHIEWLLAIGVLERHTEKLFLTGFGQRLMDDLNEGDWIAPESNSGREKQNQRGRQSQEPLSTLREKAERDASSSASASVNTHEVIEYERSRNVRDYAKARAEGICEGCGEPAPFTSQTGDPYLQAHHIHEVSGGGPDTPETVIALCPNCHYRVHHGQDGEAFNHELAHRLAEIEETSIDDVLGGVSS